MIGEANRMAGPGERTPEFAFQVEGEKGKAVRLSISGSIALENLLFLRSRSEERRVGKECRSRWSPYH